MIRQILTLVLCVYTANADSCVSRDFGNGGTVCVCNATYCDFSPNVTTPETGSFLMYTSNKAGLRLEQTEDQFSNESLNAITLKVNTSATYQTIHGFGGAFTDSAGMNIKNLSSGAEDNLMRSYFSQEGSNYNLGRVPIAGTDFSTRKYTYNDVKNDTTLDNFELAEEDFDYKIPLMQKALEMNSELRFISSSWTAPPWMKTNNDYVGIGFLKEEYYQLYADYHIKFLDKYKAYGLEMWAITTGNEPINGIIPLTGFNSMGWTPSTVAKWIAENLGPTLRSSEHNKTLITCLDDQSFFLPWFVDAIFKNEAAMNYTDGVAFHWYWDDVVPSSVLTKTHNKHPEKFIIMTEASVGDKPWQFTKVVLGSWSRGQKYIVDIIKNLNHWVTGWVDWNLALNQQGGPNWKENYVDSAIIVNADDDEFYKQPLYYAITHFSKFIPPGSVRIGITDSTYVKSVAFKTPNNETVLVLYNKKWRTQDVTVQDPDRGYINLQLPRYSIHTIIYK